MSTFKFVARPLLGVCPAGRSIQTGRLDLWDVILYVTKAYNGSAVEAQKREQEPRDKAVTSERSMRGYNMDIV